MLAGATGMPQMAIDATQSGISLGVLCKMWPLGTAQMGYVQHILPRQGKNERPAAKTFILSRTGNLFSASRASEGRFHARPIILRRPVRQKADFTHGQSFCGIPCARRPPFVTKTLAEGTAGQERSGPGYPFTGDFFFNEEEQKGRPGRAAKNAAESRYFS